MFRENFLLDNQTLAYYFVGKSDTKLNYDDN